MALFIIDKELSFPPVELAEPDGLMAVGGDLSTDRLLLAYRKGIFPWYEGEHILWWCPDPRFVLFPNDLKINRQMQKILQGFNAGDRQPFSGLTINKSFREVIHHCKDIKRPGQLGTWITDEVEKAYCRLHEQGYAHSAEVWQGEELVGGLYGLRLGNVFFGESMFSKASNASRFAFINYVQQLRSEGVQLIDCQVYTEYLESLGAKMLPRREFIQLLNEFCPAP